MRIKPVGHVTMEKQRKYCKRTFILLFILFHSQFLYRRIYEFSTRDIFSNTNLHREINSNEFMRKPDRFHKFESYISTKEKINFAPELLRTRSWPRPFFFWFSIFFFPTRQRYETGENTEFFQVVDMVRGGIDCSTKGLFKFTPGILIGRNEPFDLNFRNGWRNNDRFIYKAVFYFYFLNNFYVWKIFNSQNISLFDDIMY